LAISSWLIVAAGAWGYKIKLCVCQRQPIQIVKE
jgi:hypothetical protein